ncbi:hypothetical protein LCGC14_0716280 [marine sediment metagenome]|uniref:HNH nuclease domain-containing protein n=1 Tax=marine sediment metagenome TaxID=412755 RepID=A0A0F9QI09_9ZZZZ
MDNLKEIWKDIKGYEGLYQVSDLGEIKSLDRVIYSKFRSIQTFKGRILRKLIHNNGYVSIMLSKKGITKRFIIHRIVAKSFILNLQNKKEVNHKNLIKGDNRAENLEWVTPKENMKHADKNIDLYQKGSLNKRSKSCIQISLDGLLVGMYGSRNEAFRKTGVNAAHISDVISGNRKMAGGYKWQ